MARAHDPRNGQILAGFIRQHLPPSLTDEQINDLLHNPEGMQAFLAGLTNLPAALRALAAIPTPLPVARVDVGDGRQVEVVLLADAIDGSSGLKSIGLPGAENWESAARAVNPMCFPDASGDPGTLRYNPRD